jgi:hypothetical protein
MQHPEEASCGIGTGPPPPPPSVATAHETLTSQGTITGPSPAGIPAFVRSGGAEGSGPRGRPHGGRSDSACEAAAITQASRRSDR